MVLMLSGLQTQWLWVRVPLQSQKLQILHLSRARSSLTFKQLCIVWIHSETRTWLDKKIQSLKLILFKYFRWSITIRPLILQFEHVHWLKYGNIERTVKRLKTLFGRWLVWQPIKFPQLNYNQIQLKSINQTIVFDSKWIKIIHHKITIARTWLIARKTWMDID